MAADHHPIEALYDRYAAMLYRLALSMLRRPEDAEDAVQSVFEKYMLRPRLFLSPEHEKAWMLRVTINQCKDALRRRNLRRSIPLEETAEIGVWDSHSEVLDALQQLPEEYRMPLLLYYYEDCQVSEIAKALGIGPSAVKMRLKRGREKLKEMLEDKHV